MDMPTITARANTSSNILFILILLILLLVGRAGFPLGGAKNTMKTAQPQNNLPETTRDLSYDRPV